MGLKSAILSKLGWIVLSFVAFYFVGSVFGIVPQQIQDMVSWGADNFSQIVLLVCLLSAVLLIHEIINRKKVQ